MGDADLVHPKKTPEEKDAIDYILETVRNDPGEVEIVALGPVTNIALAIMRDRETMLKVSVSGRWALQDLVPETQHPYRNSMYIRMLPHIRSCLNSECT